MPQKVLLSNSELDSLLLASIEAVPLYYQVVSFQLELLYLTGVRANEVTSFNSWQLVNPHTVSMLPQKKNNLRVFNVSDLPLDFMYWFNNSNEYLKHSSYRRLQYYYFSKVAAYDFTVGNRSVLLHLFRHNYIKKLHDNGNTPVQIQNIVGHKEIINTMDYINSQVFSYHNIFL